MSRFHTLPVADIVRETSDCISIGFEVPEERRADFAFLHGQYLTLKVMVDGTELRRSYSICSSPLKPEKVRIAVKKVAGGRVSSQLVDRLKVGDELEVMTPMGNFTTPLDAAQERHFVAFAGGSGITPMLSILQAVLASEPKSRFTLCYANSDAERIIFKAQLDELAAAWPQRFQLVTIVDGPKKGGVFGLFKSKPAGDPLLTGIMTREKVAALLDRYVPDAKAAEYFICGPLPMMDNVATELEHRGVDKARVHLELFTSPVTDAPPRPVEKTKAGDAVAEVSVTLDGVTKELRIPFKGPHILDAASDAGMDVPYSCKGGVCSTCRAKVLEGQVEMDMNYALTDGEVAQGYVLTCQSHPRSPRVVIDFDQP